ncbi:SURF1 family protein [Chenggangzhangella methanolivorans]|uniref:SURF1-like protein n=1 Tax=Chenggangzhangella methanolivorans TaxID=1437009 RepID=A0A9E6RF42_9HYPH|nr:SURF1 family protein [Chenggangzhangella methanolivorans]QZO02394.1 SURF1 family protein [Chenggangzhangella methanolivorans]
MGLAALVIFGGFVSLGVWQLERRVWKLDLIERVDARIHAAPVAAPGPAEWPETSADRDAYRRVIAAGAFIPGKTALTQAVTEQGAGFWVLAPLKTTQGFTVLVNRGFVPADKRGEAEAMTPAGPVAVTGLLRVSEPGGGFLRANDPGAERWTSRDVAAIAAARGLEGVAPYFIDADATQNPGGLPVGGLTVVSFRNSHLVYALTWFALAAMVAGGAAILFAHERALRRR